MNIDSALADFAASAKFRGKGPLSVALVITRRARAGLPLNPANLLAESGTQVEGLGKAAVQAILAKHDIARTLSEEGGRTSRGSVRNMELYVAFLNKLPQPVDLDRVEAFWVNEVKKFFAGKPFRFRGDTALSVRASIREVLTQAQARQKDFPGAQFAGTILQHLVGAKLELIVGDGSIVHHSASEADQAERRGGDFMLGDVAVHVTTAPGEAVIRKCSENISSGLRPVLITIGKGVAVAEGLAEQAGISARIDILDGEQFLAANIHEWGRFSTATRTVATSDLIARYNQIVESKETDPSLLIEISR